MGWDNFLFVTTYTLFFLLSLFSIYLPFGDLVGSPSLSLSLFMHYFLYFLTRMQIRFFGKGLECHYVHVKVQNFL